MNKIYKFTLLVIFCGVLAFNVFAQNQNSKIKVLNFGTFHMGATSDANKTEFDERDEKNRKAVHEVAKKLAEFKPTVLIVERIPEYDEKLKSKYAEYLKKPETRYKNPTEIELLAFELGRLSDTKRIYGIDHKMGYNYRIGSQIKNAVDSKTYKDFEKNPYGMVSDINKGDPNKLSLFDKLKLFNHNKFLDFLITANADILTHAGTDNNFEGADEAAKYYQRNLRMYLNLNRIPLKKDDRVFILMGASHTAFFRDFMSRSPKYEMVNTFKYLK